MVVGRQSHRKDWAKLVVVLRVVACRVVEPGHRREQIGPLVGGGKAVGRVIVGIVGIIGRSGKRDVGLHLIRGRTVEGQHQARGKSVFDGRPKTHGFLKPLTLVNGAVGVLGHPPEQIEVDVQPGSSETVVQSPVDVCKRTADCVGAVAAVDIAVVPSTKRRLKAQFPCPVKHTGKGAGTGAQRVVQSHARHSNRSRCKLRIPCRLSTRKIQGFGGRRREFGLGSRLGGCLRLLTGRWRGVRSRSWDWTGLGKRGRWQRDRRGRHLVGGVHRRGLGKGLRSGRRGDLARGGGRRSLISRSRDISGCSLGIRSVLSKHHLASTRHDEECKQNRAEFS